MKLGSLKCIFPSAGCSQEGREGDDFAMNLESLKCIFPAKNRAVNDSTAVESTATVFPLKKSFHKNFQYPHAENYWEVEAKNYRHALLNEINDHSIEAQNCFPSRSGSNLQQRRIHTKSKDSYADSFKDIPDARLYLAMESDRPDRIQLRENLYQQHRHATREKRYHSSKRGSGFPVEKKPICIKSHFDAILNVQEDDSQSYLDLDLSGFTRSTTDRNFPDGLEQPPLPKTKVLFQEYIRLKAISEKLEHGSKVRKTRRIIDVEDPNIVRAALRRSSSFGSVRDMETRSTRPHIALKHSPLDSFALKDPTFASDSSSTIDRGDPVAVNDIHFDCSRSAIQKIKVPSSQHSKALAHTFPTSIDLNGVAFVSESSSPLTYCETNSDTDDGGSRETKELAIFGSHIHLLEQQSTGRIVKSSQALESLSNLLDPIFVSETTSPSTFPEDRPAIDLSRKGYSGKPKSIRTLNTNKLQFQDFHAFQDPMVVSEISFPPAFQQTFRPVTPSPKSSVGGYDDSILIEPPRERHALQTRQAQDYFVEDRFIPAYSDSVIIQPVSPHAYSNHDGFEPEPAPQAGSRGSRMSPTSRNTQPYRRKIFTDLNEDVPAVSRTSQETKSKFRAPYPTTEAEPVRVDHLPMGHSEYLEFSRQSPPSKSCLPSLNKEYLKRLPVALTAGRYKTLVDSPQLTRRSQQFGVQLEI